MAEKNNYKPYIVIGGMLLVVALLIIFRNKITDAFVKSSLSQQQPTAPAGAPAAGLDYSKVLARGSKGEEVKALQTFLGINADGDFGPVTEQALQTRKGVSSITLTQFAQMANVNTTDNPSGDITSYAAANPFSWLF